MQKWTPGTHRGVFRCDVQQNIMMSRNETRGLVIGEAVGQKGASEIFIQCRTEEVSGTMARMESCIEVAVQGTGMIHVQHPDRSKTSRRNARSSPLRYLRNLGYPTSKALHPRITANSHHVTLS
jgi:hypothetical protein